MIAMISKGLTGLTWSAPGSRSTAPGCSNPFWVALNTFLRSLGIDALAAGAQEPYFDVSSAAACAGIADTVVNALFGGGTENQFRFKGTLDTLKPLRDQIRDILNNAMGYFTWSFGKLKLGCRINATPETFFTSGNMLFRSLRIEPLKPAFEKLTISFADEEYLFQKNTVDYVDQDYALRNGRVQNPKASQFGLIGSSTKSQVARIATIRTREELGGVGVDEQKNARVASWKTTILGLDTEAGRVTGVIDPNVPTGYGAFRIQSWRLNRDWSIDISAKSVTDSMYDMSNGTVPVDVPTPEQPIQAPRDSDVPPAPLFSGRVALDDPTSAEVYDLSLTSTVNIRTITSGTWTFYYFDATATMPTLTASLTAGATSMTVSSATGISNGTYMRIGSEIVLAGTPSGTTVPITRAQFTTSAASHSSGATVTILSARAVGTSFPPDFFTSPALATWTMRTSLPGQTVIAISGYVTNAYGNSPTTTILVNLVLSKPLVHPGVHAVDGDIAIWMSDEVVDSGVLLTSIATKLGVQQEAYTYAADSGTANAYAVTLSPVPTLLAGSVVVLKIAHTNTGASTLAVNGGSATAVKKASTGLLNLAAGEFQAGQIAVVIYDGTVWQWVSGNGIGVPGTGFNPADAEVPAGTLGGGNPTFTLAHSPSPAASLLLYLNPVLQVQGRDYTLSGNTITYNIPPNPNEGGDWHVCWYRY
jgi:hypothetical protein